MSEKKTYDGTRKDPMDDALEALTRQSARDKRILGVLDSAYHGDKSYMSK